MTKRQLRARVGELEWKLEKLDAELRAERLTIETMKGVPEGCCYGNYCGGCVYGGLKFDPNTGKTRFCTYGACKHFVPLGKKEG